MKRKEKRVELLAQAELERRLAVPQRQELRSDSAQAELAVGSGFAVLSSSGFAVLSSSGFAVLSSSGFAVL